MNVSTTIPPTVQIGRGRLLSLMGAVAVLAAAVTWALLVFAVDTGTVKLRGRGARALRLLSRRRLWSRFANGIGKIAQAQQNAAAASMPSGSRPEARAASGPSWI